ncbi:MAG: hypothetical protein ACFCGT_15110 [Sandaracinaceae bacterium]
MSTVLRLLAVYLAALLTLALAGCEEEEEPTTDRSSEETEAESAEDEDEPEAEDEEEGEQAADRDRSRDHVDPIEQAMDQLPRVAPTREESVEACRRAYEEQAGFLGQLAAAGGRSAEIATNQDLFVEGCQHLPESVQRCMGLQYRINHMDECRSATASLEGPARTLYDGLGRTRDVPAAAAPGSE